MNNTNCAYCDYCTNCAACASCDSCDYCAYCMSCKNLKMTEYNYFCWSEKLNDRDSFQQPRYRVFNVQLSKEEYEKIPKINLELKFDRNEPSAKRYQTAFRKMWQRLTKEEQKKYLDIPHFNWEGFTFITGITKEDGESKKKIILDGKEIEISEESFETFKKQFTN